MTVTDITNLKKGTVLLKGVRKRVFMGFDEEFVYYRSPSSRGTVGESWSHFSKWAKGAQLLT